MTRVKLHRDRRRGTARMMLTAIASELGQDVTTLDPYTQRVIAPDGLTIAAFTNSQDGYTMLRVTKGRACLEYTELSGEIFTTGRPTQDLVTLLIAALARATALYLEA